MANQPVPVPATGNNPLMSVISRPHTRSQARDNPQDPQEGAVAPPPQPSEANQMVLLTYTGTHPKTHAVMVREQAVVTRQEYEVDQERPPVITNTQVTNSCFEYSPDLDPGDPINASPVPVLQPVHGSDSDLIGFTGPQLRYQSTSKEAGPTKGKKKGGVERKGLDTVNQTEGAPFSIYHDPIESPSTVTYTMHNQPITYPYWNTRNPARIPLATLKPRSDNPSPKRRGLGSRDSGSFPDIDAGGLSEPATHSTPNFRNREVRSPDVGPLGHRPGESAANKVQYYRDHLREIQEHRASS